MTAPFQSLFPDDPQRPASPQKSDAFASLFPDDKKERAARLEALSRNPLGSPAEVGEAAQLGRTLQLPTDVVARNLAMVRPLAVRNGPDWNKFIDDAPKTARWLENPVNHSLAADDTESLGMLERLARFRFSRAFGQAMGGQSMLAPQPMERGILAAEWKRGQLQVERGRLGALPSEQRRSPEVQERVAAIDAELAKSLPEAEGFARFVRGTTAILPGMAAGAVEMAAGAGVGYVVGGGLGFALGGPAGMMVGAPMGAKVGGVFGGVQETASQIGGNLTLDLERKGVDPTTADLAGRTAGWLGGGVEYTNIGMVLKPFANVFGQGASRALTRPTVRAAVADAARYYGKTLGTETTEEVVQQAISLAAENVAGQVAGVDTGVTQDRVLNELGQTVTETLVAMALLPIPGTALVGIDGIAQAQAATSRREALAQAVEMARKSQTRTRDPEAFREVVKEQVDGQVVYLDAERASVLLQEANVTPEEFVRLAGITMQDWTNATQQTGSELSLPVDALLTNLAELPLAEAMLPDLRFEVGGMTAREAEALGQNLEQFRERVAQEAEAVGTIAETDPAFRIVEDLRAKLDATGQFTPQQAAEQAQVAAKPYVVWARAIASQNPDNPMADPWTLYSRKGGLGVFGGQRAEALFDAEMAVARAKREGRTQEEVDALRDRVTKLADERVAVRAVLEDADQVLDVRDEAGRLRQSLRHVSTDALVVEYIRLREIAVSANAELAGIEAVVQSNQQGEAVTPEQEVSAVSDAGFQIPEMDDAETWAGKRAAYQRYLRGLRGQVRKVERSVPRLGRELEARGIDNPDQYAVENGLEGTFAVPSAEVPFQRPVTASELMLLDAQEARQWSAQGWTPQEIADELGTSVARVERLLAMPAVDVPRELELRMAFNGVEMLMQAAFHGSPYVFDKFSLSAIGTGEGAQAYGWGLYFAENEGVAKGYRAALSRISDDILREMTRMMPEQYRGSLDNANRIVQDINDAIESKEVENASQYLRDYTIAPQLLPAYELAAKTIDSTGALYRVDIPDEAVARMLDWDKPLSEQAPEVLQGMREVFASRGLTSFVLEEMTGEGAYQSLTEWSAVRLDGDPQKNASLALLAAGIPGIKYLDAGSRGAGDGTRNLVVFDDALVTITHRNGEPVTAQERADFLAQEQTPQALSADKVFAAGVEAMESLVPVTGARDQGAYSVPAARAIFDADFLGWYAAEFDPANPDTRAQVETFLRDSGIKPTGKYAKAFVGAVVSAIESSRTAPALPDTLDVDGTMRPTRNSNGQPIHPTEEGVRNFWRWFGDSKVVDAEGRPLVVYHGTSAQFDVFDISKLSSRNEGPGFYFTTSEAVASGYVNRSGSEGRLIAAYLRADSPLQYSAKPLKAGKLQTLVKRIAKLESDGEAIDARDGFLANFGDTYGGGIDGAARQAATLIANDESAVDQISGIVGSGVSAEYVLSAFTETTGHDSIVARGFSDEGDASNTIYVVFRSEQVKDLGNSGEFGPTPNILRQGGMRPNAYYLRSQRVIGLMRGTNLSSFLHEMSHDYLATLQAVVTDPDAPAWLVQDFETAMTHIGVKDEDRVPFVQYLRTGMGRTDAETKAFVKAEEKWARSFESYLEKGEAPSRDLLRALANFRVWLGQVYRKVRAMLIPVSAELRGVFDRMLATDEEIAEYRQFPEARPLFTERPEGMTDAQWTEYNKGFRTRDAVLDGALVKRVLAEQRAAVDADWANRRAEVESRIREELDADPVVQAVAFLRDGVDGEPMKLNRALLNEVAPDLWKSLPKGTTAADGTMTLDAVALRLGFPDEATLLALLQRYEETDAVVARRLAETFRREYGDLLGDSAAMADAVAEVTHNAEGDAPIVRELKALGRQLGIRVVDKPALVQVAREMLGGMAVRDIQPYKYEQAEAREARLAERAMRDGKPDVAAFHKRRQLLNRILVREAQAALKEAERTRTFAVRMAGDSAQATLGKAGEQFTDAMNAILTDYEFARIPRKQLTRREALRVYVADVTAKGGVPMLSDAIVDDAQQVNYRSLTTDQLRGVDAAMRQIWHHAKHVETIAKEGRRVSLDQAEDEVVASLAKHRPNTPMDTEDYPLGLPWAKDLAQGIDAWHVPPTFLFRWLDGDNYGVMWDTFYRPVKEAEDAELVRMKAAADRITDIEKMVDWSPTLTDRPKRYDGIRSPLTKRQLIALASNWGNVSSREAVLEARTADGLPQFGSATSIERAFSETLTAKDWAYIQAKWDFINEFWPGIAELERRTSGFTPEKIEASAFLIRTADGQDVAVKGGYYPLAYDQRLGRGKGAERNPLNLGENDLGTIQLVGGARAQTRHGWTNERVGSANKPIDLSLGVFNRHVASVIHDLTHREVVRDVYALLSRPGVRQAFTTAAGLKYYDAVKAWLFRVANPMATVGDTSYVERIFAAARVGTTAVNLGLKFSTGVAQTLGYLQSVEAIGPKWMAVGMGELVAQRGKAVDFVMASSPMMANRRFNYNRDVADYARSKFGKMTQLDAFNFWFIGYMDGMVSIPTWIGAYRKALAGNGNDHAAAVRVADDTVESTQGAGSAKDLSRIQGGPEFRKLLTMHYTAFSRMYGQFRRAGTNVQLGKYGLPRFAAAMTLLWFGQVVLSELMAGRGPEDDDNALEYWFTRIAKFPASLVVGVRDVVNAIGPDAFGYTMTPAEAAMERTARAVNVVYRETLGDLFFGADRELTEAEARALIEAPGYWLRLPSKAIWQYGDYLMDWAQGEVAPQNPLEAAGGLLLNRR